MGAYIGPNAEVSLTHGNNTLIFLQSYGQPKILLKLDQIE